MHREPHREWLNSDRRHNMSDLGTFCQCGSVSCPHLCSKCTKQSICGGGPLATEGGQLAAGAVQCAILDFKEAEFGWEGELVTTKTCEFSEGKTNESIVLA